MREKLSPLPALILGLLLVGGGPSPAGLQPQLPAADYYSYEVYYDGLPISARNAAYDADIDDYSANDADLSASYVAPKEEGGASVQGPVTAPDDDLSEENFDYIDEQTSTDTKAPPSSAEKDADVDEVEEAVPDVGVRSSNAKSRPKDVDVGELDDAVPEGGVRSSNVDSKTKVRPGPPRPPGPPGPPQPPPPEKKAVDNKTITTDVALSSIALNSVVSKVSAALLDAAMIDLNIQIAQYLIGRQVANVAAQRDVAQVSVRPPAKKKNNNVDEAVFDEEEGPTPRERRPISRSKTASKCGSSGSKSKSGARCLPASSQSRRREPRLRVVGDATGNNGIGLGQTSALIGNNLIQSRLTGLLTALQQLQQVQQLQPPLQQDSTSSRLQLQSG
jgi:hypothetical protein